jgi:hypothetical protein
VIAATTFELIVNRNTAKELHLDISQSILGRADEVIAYQYSLLQRMSPEVAAMGIEDVSPPKLTVGG